MITSHPAVPRIPFPDSSAHPCLTLLRTVEAHAAVCQQERRQYIFVESFELLGLIPGSRWRITSVHSLIVLYLLLLLLLHGGSPTPIPGCGHRHRNDKVPFCRRAHVRQTLQSGGREQVLQEEEEGRRKLPPGLQLWNNNAKILMQKKIKNKNLKVLVLLRAN